MNLISCTAILNNKAIPSQGSSVENCLHTGAQRTAIKTSEERVIISIIACCGEGESNADIKPKLKIEKNEIIIFRLIDFIASINTRREEEKADNRMNAHNIKLISVIRLPL